jgi:DNA-binding GntR family transcriptional regulator
MEIPRDSMRAQIRRALVQRIIEGRYRPGDRLVELQIAREFHTSQGPVREALRELEALRLVETRTYKGTRVRSLSDKEMREAGHVRGLLEQDAARTAAAALERDVADLRGDFEAVLAAAAAGDLDGYARHNLAFHRRIVQAAGNEVLLRIWDSLMLEARTRIGLSRVEADLVRVAETHAPIVAAFARGDGEEAGRLLREHAVMFIGDAQGLFEPADAPPAATVGRG